VSGSGEKSSKSTVYRHFEVQPIKRAREATLQRFELEVVQLHEVAQQLLQEVLKRATTPGEHKRSPVQRVAAQQKDEKAVL
jgi:hypothetical protein